MSASPLVSICCITYNHAPYIRQCLDSFFMQQCDFDFEVLIHDDASTDGTQEIIKEYQQKYPDIIKPIFQTENQWSKGMRGPNPKYNYPRVQGKYIALCEGDDYWTDPLKLQKQVDFLENNPEYSFCGHLYSISRERETYNKKEKEEKKNIYLKSNSTITLENYIKTKSIKTLTVLFRADYTKEGFFNYAFLKKIAVKSGDWLLFYNLLLFGNCYIFPENMGVYRIHSGGVSQQRKNTFLRANLICLLKTLRLSLNHKDSVITKQKKRVLFKKTTSLMYLSLRKRENLDLLKYYSLCSLKYLIKF